MNTLHLFFKPVPKQKLITVITMIIISGSIVASYSDWNRIGLAGIDITAITTSIDILHNKQTIVIIGTENGDVLSVKTRQNNGVYVVVQGEKFRKRQVIVPEMYR